MKVFVSSDAAYLAALFERISSGLKGNLKKLAAFLILMKKMTCCLSIQSLLYQLNK
jgi:hypothetical protein